MGRQSEEDRQDESPLNFLLESHVDSSITLLCMQLALVMLLGSLLVDLTLYLPLRNPLPQGAN